MQQEWLGALGWYVAILVVGVCATAPAYSRLFRLLADEEPDTFERLGSPTLWNRSPRKSWALQRYLYVESRTASLSPQLARLCAYLRIATPALVLAVLVAVGMLAHAIGLAASA